MEVLQVRAFSNQAEQMTPEGEVVWVWVPHDTTLWSWRSDVKICATKKHERQ